MDKKASLPHSYINIPPNFVIPSTNYSPMMSPYPLVDDGDVHLPSRRRRVDAVPLMNQSDEARTLRSDPQLRKAVENDYARGPTIGMFYRGEVINVSPPLHEPYPTLDPTVVDRSLGDILDPNAALDALLDRAEAKGPPLPEDFSVPPDIRLASLTDIVAQR
ncbi:hypothetical protein PM082_004970 [Marasmius tenuissimus]|nr:hypothetical protein PM082_004970 [Marasmius tenuissimus]